jgi:hypothetical protein
MNLIRNTFKSAAQYPVPDLSTRFGQEPGVLALGMTPGTDLCWYRRDLDAVLRQQLDRACGTAEVGALEWEVARGSSIASVPPAFAQVADFLVDEVRALTEQFCEALGVEAARVALKVSSTDDCQRFHVDHVPGRILCTYSGPGTELILPADVDWRGIHRRFMSMQKANDATLRAGASVTQVPVGHAIFLRGHRGPLRPTSGAVHRSPAIAARGLRRLLVRIDTLDACRC